MAVNGLLDMALNIIEWVLDWIVILCAMVFLLIMVWTLIEVSGNIATLSAPGLRRLFGWDRKG